MISSITQGLGKGYEPKPSALADITYLAIGNSGDHKNPHPIIHGYSETYGSYGSRPLKMTIDISSLEL